MSFKSAEILSGRSIPADWSIGLLDELVDINQKSLSGTNHPEKIKYLDISSVGTRIADQPKEMPFSEAPSRARRVISAGDTLISTVRPNLRSFIYANETMAGVIASTGFAVVTPKLKSDSKFIYYLLTNDIFISFLTRISDGAAYPSFNPSFLKSAEFPFPSPRERERIGDFLWAIESKINILRESNKVLESFPQSIYKSWFIDFEPVGLKQKGLDLGLINEGLENYFPSSFVESNIGLIPEGWECVKATELFKFKKGCEPGTKNYLNIDSDETAPFIRVGDLSKRQSDIFVNKTTYSNSLVSRTDILLTTDGTIGITAYGYTGVISGGIRKVTYQNEGSGFYIFSTLKTRLFQDQLDSFSPSETSIKHAGTALPQICLIKPPKNLIDAFDVFSKPFFEKMLNNQAQIETLTSLLNSLLPKLISGEIKVT